MSKIITELSLIKDNNDFNYKINNDGISYNDPIEQIDEQIDDISDLKKYYTKEDIIHELAYNIYDKICDDIDIPLIDIYDFLMDESIFTEI